MADSVQTIAKIVRGSLVDICDEAGPVERRVVDDVTRGRVTLEDGRVYWAKSPAIRLVEGISWDHNNRREIPPLAHRLDYHIGRVIWDDLPPGTMMSMVQLRARVANATPSQVERAKANLSVAKGIKNG